MTTLRPLEISCEEVRDHLRGGHPCLLVDCREQPEFEIAVIDGALLLPMSQIAQRVGELDGYTGQHVIVYCHHGGRSAQVAAWLRSIGFPDAQSMAGGIDRWATTIDPSLPRY